MSTKAQRYQEGIENQYRKLVLGATGAKLVDRLHAEIEAQIVLAAHAVPTPGFSRALLEMWARDHAGTNKKEVTSDQLAKVSENVRYALEQPDSFVTQCLHEWRKRGLPVTPELEATMTAELSQHGVHKLTISGGESSKNKEQAMALTAQKLFSGREFVWKDVEELQGFDTNRIKGGNVYSAPVLVATGATCAVERFEYRVVERYEYRVKGHGVTIGGTSRPGDATFQAYGVATATGEDAGIAVYDLMRELRGYGVTFAQKPDALHNPWVQQMFGANGDPEAAADRRPAVSSRGVRRRRAPRSTERRRPRAGQSLPEAGEYRRRRLGQQP